MEPDRTLLRPMEGPGQKTQALRKMGAIGPAANHPEKEVEGDKRQKNELK
jgi:hypothetical protein